MSQPSSGDPNPFPQPTTSSAPQKQRFNIYTMMMFLAFAALLTGCILLYLELKLWGDIPAW